MPEPELHERHGAAGDYFAAERTFLAWIRTGVALMGFGFVVARFGLFLQELHVIQANATVRTYGVSLWFGTALIALGVLVNVASAVHHVHVIDQLKRGATAFERPSRTAIVVAAFLALVGLAMAVYLITLQSTR